MEQEQLIAAILGGDIDALRPFIVQLSNIRGKKTGYSVQLIFDHSVHPYGPILPELNKREMDYRIEARTFENPPSKKTSLIFLGKVATYFLTVTYPDKERTHKPFENKVLRLRGQLVKLNKALQRAVEGERYEEAAELRNEINNSTIGTNG